MVYCRLQCQYDFKYFLLRALLLWWISTFLIQAIAWTYSPWISMEILGTIAVGNLVCYALPLKVRGRKSSSACHDNVLTWALALGIFIAGPLLQNLVGYEEEAPFLSLFFWNIQDEPSHRLLVTNVFSRWLWSDPGWP